MEAPSAMAGLLSWAPGRGAAAACIGCSLTFLVGLQLARRTRGDLGAWGFRSGSAFPSRDDAHALAGLGVVGDEREVAAELDDARELAALVIRAADHFGGCIVHKKHAALIRLGW